MNCKRAKTQIALSVGNDLDKGLHRDLKGHLSVCHACRAYWRRMKHSLSTLHEHEDVAAPRPFKSVWPELATSLPVRAKSTRRERFNGWAAGAAVVAACSVLVVYAVTYQSPNSSPMMTPGRASFVDAEGYRSNEVNQSPIWGSSPGSLSGDMLLPAGGPPGDEATNYRKSDSPRRGFDSLLDEF